MRSPSPEHIIYPAGHHAVGKTELCDYLEERYGFEVVETGAMVRSLYADRDEEFAGLSLGEFVKVVEGREPGYFDKKLATRIDTLDGEQGRVIVNGMRSFTNIERARQHYPDTRHSIVWMEADFDRLYERYKLREGKDLSVVEFKDLLDFDMELGLAMIKDNADYVIKNNDTVDVLQHNANDVMRSLGIAALNAADSESAQQ